jgi:putative two-component system response regulator
VAREYILCVDDESIILMSVRKELRKEFGREIDVETAASGREALELIDELAAKGGEPAVLVSDQRMPGMDGSELFELTKRKFPDVLCIMLTGYMDAQALKDSVNNAGLFRFLGKPWAALDLALSCRRALQLWRGARLNRELLAQMQAINSTVVSLLEKVIDCHDPQTYSHVRRVSAYSELLARSIGVDELTRRKLFAYTPLHDLGKVGIPQAILSKPGPLDEIEFETVKGHVRIGAELVSGIDPDPLLLDVILYHHERWDGGGYPEGLAGVGIPLCARIVAVADVLDALLSERPYKAALDFESAVRVINEEGEGHFDPAILRAFNGSLPALRQLSSKRLLEIVFYPGQPEP